MIRTSSALALLITLVPLGFQAGCDSGRKGESAGGETVLRSHSGEDADQRAEQVKRWLAQLQGSDRVAAQVAAESLQSLSAEDAAAVPVLVEAMESTNVNVRRFSARALGSIGGAAHAAVQPLIDATLEAGGDWQYAAVSVVEVAQTHPESVELIGDTLRSANGDARFRMLWIASELDPPAPSLAETFAKELRSPDPKAREKACFAIARLGKPAVVKYISELTDLIHDTDTEVRKMAIGTIFNAAPETIEAVKPLEKLLDDPDPEIQRDAAVALAAFGEKASGALDRLVTLAESDDKDLRLAALIAIGQIGDAASAIVDRIAAGMNDPDEKIRQVTIQTLVRIAPDHDKTTQGVIAALDENSEVNRSFVLGTIGDELQEPAPAIAQRLLDSLEDPRELTRINAMEVLLKLAGRSQVFREQLVSELNQSDRVQETLRSEAMLDVIRRNHEYIKIGLAERGQEVLDAFELVRAEAAKRAGSAADRITVEVERQNQP